MKKNKQLIPIINNDWDIILKKEFKKDAFIKLLKFIKEERNKYNIFPKEEKVFNALKLSSFAKTKIVILGQDPYHKKGQANGLSFSVANGINIPPSLKNIFKELKNDLQINISQNGNLENWANQGILLLNSILTVREKHPESHKKIGWEKFTDTIISKLSSKKEGLIFMLWGKFAQNKEKLINKKKHYILKANHPSPLSAYRGFLGCKHFSKTNKILISNKKKPIDWGLCSNTLTLF